MLPPVPTKSTAKKTASGQKKVQGGRKPKSTAGPLTSKVFSESLLAKYKDSRGGPRV
jgi:hypothetical protein